MIEDAGFAATVDRFTDVEDLLLLDPIHEVDETGWPRAAAFEHAARRAAVPLRWLTDAAAISLVAATRLEYDTLCTQTIARRHAPGARHAALHSPRARPRVPAETLRRLDASPVSTIERIEYAAMTRRSELLGRLPQLAFQYVRNSRDRHGWRRARSFAEFLQNEWDLEDLRQVPGAILHKSLARARRRLG